MQDLRPIISYTRFSYIAVSPILADPDKSNCAEQMHDSQPSGRIPTLDQSEFVRSIGCSCSGRPESKETVRALLTMRCYPHIQATLHNVSH